MDDRRIAVIYQEWMAPSFFLPVLPVLGVHSHRELELPQPAVAAGGGVMEASP